MKKKQKGLMLSEAIEQMSNAIQNMDLSDGFLKRRKCTTREDFFAGEWSYGITAVPCTFAIQLARKVLEKEGDQFIPYDTEE